MVRNGAFWMLRIRRLGTLKPSEINHGNVTPTISSVEKKEPGGVTFREAVQTTVLSLTQLRKLRFPNADGSISPDRDVAGRAVIAALGILAVLLQQEEGYQLRSRCHLVPSEASQFEAISRTEQERESFGIDSAPPPEHLTERSPRRKSTG